MEYYADITVYFTGITVELVKILTCEMETYVSYRIVYRSMSKGNIEKANWYSKLFTAYCSGQCRHPTEAQLYPRWKEERSMNKIASDIYRIVLAKN